MADNTTTYLDELIEFPSIVIRAIGTNKTVVSLLTDNPDVDMESDEAYDVFKNFIFDYDYVGDTPHNASAFICVDVEMPSISSPTMKNMSIFVTVRCHRNFAALDPKKFKGLHGNRKDNLVRFIDKVINGSDLFGIGPLELTSARSVSSPKDYTSRELTYKVPEFRKK